MQSSGAVLSKVTHEFPGGPFFIYQTKQGPLMVSSRS
jgi:hypothetical protein